MDDKEKIKRLEASLDMASDQNLKDFDEIRKWVFRTVIAYVVGFAIGYATRCVHEDYLNEPAEKQLYSETMKGK